MSPYGETIQEHFRHPRNYGSLDAPDIRHEDLNPLCGDRVRIDIALLEDRIREIRFQGDLCMIAKAAGSLLTEMVNGLTIDRVAGVGERDVLDALRAEIQPARRKCALLPLEVLQAGVKAWREGRTG